MSELLRSNFEEKLPGLIEKIRACSFISFDGEFSSLSTDGDNKPMFFDFPDGRYQKMWRAAQSSIIIQFGFSLFTNTGTNNYQVESFVAYTLPFPVELFKNEEEDLKNYKIDFSEGSKEFLTKYAFDFDKLYKEWIPFLNSKTYKELEDYLQESPEKFYNRLRSLDSEFYGNKDDSNSEENAFKFLDQAKGFSKLIEAMGSSDKPIVGHNVIADLMFSYNLYISPLPDSYNDFKSAIHAVFPTVFDTKNIAARLYKVFDHRSLKNRAERHLIKKTGLYTLFQNLSKITDHFVPKLMLDGPTKERYEEGLIEVAQKEEPSLNCHEAGFDSLLTGAIFLLLGHVSFRIDSTFFDREQPPEFKEYLSEVGTNANYVYVHRGAINEMNLTGGDKKATCPEWIRIILPNLPPAEDGVPNEPSEITKLKEGLEKFYIFSAHYDIKIVEPEEEEKKHEGLVILMAFLNKASVTKTFKYLSNQPGITFRRVDFNGETQFRHVLEPGAPNSKSLVKCPEFFA